MRLPCASLRGNGCFPVYASHPVKTHNAVLFPATSELRTPTVMANNRDADTIIKYPEEEMIGEAL